MSANEKKKRTSKALSALLAATMTLSLAAPAVAVEGEELPHNPVPCATCGGDHKVEGTTICPECSGEQEVPMIDCADCDGTGTVYTWNFDTPCPNNGPACSGCDDCFSGFAKIPVTCDTCGGSGKVVDPAAEICGTCGGTGTVQQEEDCPDCEDGTVPCTGEFVGEVTKAATCKEAGEMTYTCAACEASYTEAIPVDEDAHQWGEPEALEGQAPTCGEDGVGNRTCALCGKTEEVVMPATGEHTYGDDLKCTVCGADEPADEDTAAAIALLEALPAAEDVTAADQAAIQAARAAYDALTDRQKSFVSEELTTALTSAESALSGALVAQADALLAALPENPAGDLGAAFAAYNAVSALSEAEKTQLTQTDKLAALNTYLETVDLYSYSAAGSSAPGAWVVYDTTVNVAAPKGTKFSINPATFRFVKGTSDLNKITGYLPSGCTMDAAFQMASQLADAAEDLDDGQEIVVTLRSALTESAGSYGVYFLSGTTKWDTCELIEETELNNGTLVIRLNNQNYQKLSYIALTRSMEYTDGYTTPDTAANSYVPAERAASSDGITYDYKVEDGTRVVTVTIPADYTGDTVHVNMAAIREVFGELSVGFAENGQTVSGGYADGAALEGKEPIRPGTALPYRIEVVNLSGQKYAYTADSLWLDAAEMEHYLGYADASGIYPAFDGSSQTFAVYRTWNKALSALLDSSSDVLDDATINAALQAVYQNEDGIEVNLPHYYLDFYNFAYNTQATALDQLSADALFDLFGGERDVAETSAAGAVYSQETLPELNNLAYNFFYTRAFQLEQSSTTASDSGTSVGAAMAGRYDVLDTKAAAAWDELSAGAAEPAALEFTVTSAGPLWNAYMRYPVACDMGFTLSKVVEEPSTPSYDPDDDGDDVLPTPTPEETPEPTDPGADIPEEDVPLGDLPEDPGTDIPEEAIPQGGLPEDPGTDAPETDIPDGEVPQGDLPQTGMTTAVDPGVTAGMLALAASLAGAGLHLTFSRKKDDADA